MERERKREAEREREGERKTDGDRRNVLCCLHEHHASRLVSGTSKKAVPRMFPLKRNPYCSRIA